MNATFNALTASIFDDGLALHAMADWLEESGDPRAGATRRVARLWDAAAKLEVGESAQAWTEAEMRGELEVVCKTAEGWADAQILGVLIACHAPSGDGRRKRETWAKGSPLPGIQRDLLLIALGLLDMQEAEAAVRQAEAALRQAEAALRQAWAAVRQAEAAWQQADAARQQVWRWARACWVLILEDK